MGTERFKGALLSALVIASLIVPAISLLSVSPCSAAPEGLTPHAPIYIEGNDNFTPANGVVAGSGTAEDPYIIENWAISVEKAYDGIKIVDTTAHFVIRSCLIENGLDVPYVNNIGIRLHTVKNGRIENCTIKNTDQGIYLNKSSNNKIVKSDVSNNGSWGIELDFCSNNTLENNKVSSNSGGIYFWQSSNNKIVNNDISSNKDWIGIYLSYSPNNLIYHNKIINNYSQAYDGGSNYWDDGYSSGGNYWSDYTGVDNYWGENQDIPGSDGIGDTPYNIPGGTNQDRYPLMRPSVPLGMVAYWKFDEGSGNIAHDSSGYGNHGTIYGATWTGGKIGGALYFGGDDYVLVQSSPSLEITDELTLEAWIKVQYSADSTILTKRYRFTEVGYGLHFWDPERMVSFNVGATSYDGLKTREISLELDKWYHIAGTYIENTGEWKIYVNGILENSLTRPGNLAANNASIYIGSHDDTSFFRGVIDEIRIYNRALSPGEILKHYLVKEATVDIDPDTLNLKSNGMWITAYIELPEGFDAANIDLTTVKLTHDSFEIYAVTDPQYDFVTDPNVYIVDHDGDGVLERLVKFDRIALRDCLGVADLSDGDKFYTITLTVTGELADGTPFEGSDTIRVITA